MKKEVLTTVWLDVLTYILIPIVLLLGVISVFRTMIHITFEFYPMLMMLIEIVLLIFYGVTAYYSHKKDKKAMELLSLLTWVTAVQVSLDFANTRAMNNGDNFVLACFFYLAACYFLWIIPNRIYFQKRKSLFVNESPSIVLFPSKKKTVKKKKTSSKEEKKEKEPVKVEEEEKDFPLDKEEKKEEMDDLEEKSKEDSVEEEEEMDDLKEESNEEKKEKIESSEEEAKELGEDKKEDLD